MNHRNEIVEPPSAPVGHVPIPPPSVGDSLCSLFHECFSSLIRNDHAMGFPPLPLGELFCQLRDLIIRKLIIIFILDSSPHSCITSLLNCSPFDPASSSPKQFLLSTSITFSLCWFPAGPPGNEVERKERNEQWSSKEQRSCSPGRSSDHWKALAVTHRLSYLLEPKADSRPLSICALLTRVTKSTKGRAQSQDLYWVFLPPMLPQEPGES